MNPKEAIAFVERHGVVLQSARGSFPNLAEAIAGEPIRGSWWGHTKAYAIFNATQVIADSPNVLVCKLIDGKVTYIHKRLWPALVKLASRFPKDGLAKVREEHTKSGKHVLKRLAFPAWVPRDIMQEAKALPAGEAETLLASLLEWTGTKSKRKILD